MSFLKAIVYETNQTKATLCCYSRDLFQMVLHKTRQNPDYYIHESEPISHKTSSKRFTNHYHCNCLEIIQNGYLQIEKYIKRRFYKILIPMEILDLEGSFSRLVLCEITRNNSGESSNARYHEALRIIKTNTKLSNNSQMNNLYFGNNKACLMTLLPMLDMKYCSLNIAPNSNVERNNSMCTKASVYRECLKDLAKEVVMSGALPSQLTMNKKDKKKMTGADSRLDKSWFDYGCVMDICIKHKLDAKEIADVIKHIAAIDPLKPDPVKCIKVRCLQNCDNKQTEDQDRKHARHSRSKRSDFCPVLSSESEMENKSRKSSKSDSRKLHNLTRSHSKKSPCSISSKHLYKSSLGQREKLRHRKSNKKSRESCYKGCNQCPSSYSSSSPESSPSPIYSHVCNSSLSRSTNSRSKSTHSSSSASCTNLKVKYSSSSESSEHLEDLRHARSYSNNTRCRDWSPCRQKVPIINTCHCPGNCRSVNKRVSNQLKSCTKKLANCCHDKHDTRKRKEHVRPRRRSGSRERMHNFPVRNRETQTKKSVKVYDRAINDEASYRYNKASLKPWNRSLNSRNNVSKAIYDEMHSNPPRIYIENYLNQVHSDVDDGNALVADYRDFDEEHYVNMDNEEGDNPDEICDRFMRQSEYIDDSMLQEYCKEQPYLRNSGFVNPNTDYQNSLSLEPQFASSSYTPTRHMQSQASPNKVSHSKHTLTNPISTSQPDQKSLYLEPQFASSSYTPTHYNQSQASPNKVSHSMHTITNPRSTSQPPMSMNHLQIPFPKAKTFKLSSNHNNMSSQTPPSSLRLINVNNNTSCRDNQVQVEIIRPKLTRQKSFSDPNLPGIITMDSKSSNDGDTTELTETKKSVRGISSQTETQPQSIPTTNKTQMYTQTETSYPRLPTPFTHYHNIPYSPYKPPSKSKVTATASTSTSFPGTSSPASHRLLFKHPSFNERNMNNHTSYSSDSMSSSPFLVQHNSDINNNNDDDDDDDNELLYQVIEIDPQLSSIALVDDPGTNSLDLPLSQASDTLNKMNYRTINANNENFSDENDRIYGELHDYPPCDESDSYLHVSAHQPSKTSRHNGPSYPPSIRNITVTNSNISNPTPPFNCSPEYCLSRLQHILDLNKTLLERPIGSPIPAQQINSLYQAIYGPYDPVRGYSTNQYRSSSFQLPVEYSSIREAHSSGFDVESPEPVFMSAYELSHQNYSPNLFKTLPDNKVVCDTSFSRDIDFISPYQSHHLPRTSHSPRTNPTPLAKIEEVDSFHDETVALTSLSPTNRRFPSSGYHESPYIINPENQIYPQNTILPQGNSYIIDAYNSHLDVPTVYDSNHIQPFLPNSYIQTHDTHQQGLSLQPSQEQAPVHFSSLTDPTQYIRNDSMLKKTRSWEQTKPCGRYFPLSLSHCPVPGCSNVAVNGAPLCDNARQYMAQHPELSLPGDQISHYSYIRPSVTWSGTDDGQLTTQVTLDHEYLNQDKIKQRRLLKSAMKAASHDGQTMKNHKVSINDKAEFEYPNKEFITRTFSSQGTRLSSQDSIPENIFEEPINQTVRTFNQQGSTITHPYGPLYMFEPNNEGINRNSKSEHKTSQFTIPDYMFEDSNTQSIRSSNLRNMSSQCSIPEYMFLEPNSQSIRNSYTLGHGMSSLYSMPEYILDEANDQYINSNPLGSNIHWNSMPESIRKDPRYTSTQVPNKSQYSSNENMFVEPNNQSMKRTSSLQGPKSSQNSMPEYVIEESNNQSLKRTSSLQGPKILSQHSLRQSTFEDPNNQSMRASNMQIPKISQHTLRQNTFGDPTNQSMRASNTQGSKISPHYIRQSTFEDPNNQSINAANVQEPKTSQHSIRQSWFEDPKNQTKRASSMKGSNIPQHFIRQSTFEDPKNQSMRASNVQGPKISQHFMRQSRFEDPKNQSMRASDMKALNISQHSIRQSALEDPNNQSIKASDIKSPNKSQHSIRQSALEDPNNQSVRASNIKPPNKSQQSIRQSTFEDPNNQPMRASNMKGPNIPQHFIRQSTFEDPKNQSIRASNMNVPHIYQHNDLINQNLDPKVSKYSMQQNVFKESNNQSINRPLSLRGPKTSSYYSVPEFVSEEPNNQSIRASNIQGPIISQHSMRQNNFENPNNQSIRASNVQEPKGSHYNETINRSSDNQGPKISQHPLREHKFEESNNQSIRISNKQGPNMSQHYINENYYENPNNQSMRAFDQQGPTMISQHSSPQYTFEKPNDAALISTSNAELPKGSSQFDMMAKNSDDHMNEYFQRMTNLPSQHMNELSSSSSNQISKPSTFKLAEPLNQSMKTDSSLLQQSTNKLSNILNNDEFIPSKSEDLAITEISTPKLSDDPITEITNSSSFVVNVQPHNREPSNQSLHIQMNRSVKDSLNQHQENFNQSPDPLCMKSSKVSAHSKIGQKQRNLTRTIPRRDHKLSDRRHRQNASVKNRKSSSNEFLKTMEEFLNSKDPLNSQHQSSNNDSCKPTEYLLHSKRSYSLKNVKHYNELEENKDSQFHQKLYKSQSFESANLERVKSLRSSEFYKNLNKNQNGKFVSFRNSLDLNKSMRYLSFPDKPYLKSSLKPSKSNKSFSNSNVSKHRNLYCFQQTSPSNGFGRNSSETRLADYSNIPIEDTLKHNDFVQQRPSVAVQNEEKSEVAQIFNDKSSDEIRQFTSESSFVDTATLRAALRASNAPNYQSGKDKTYHNRQSGENVDTKPSIQNFKLNSSYSIRKPLKPTSSNKSRESHTLNNHTANRISQRSDMKLPQSTIRHSNMKSHMQTGNTNTNPTQTSNQHQQFINKKHHRNSNDTLPKKGELEKFISLQLIASLPPNTYKQSSETHVSEVPVFKLDLISSPNEYIHTQNEHEEEDSNDSTGASQCDLGMPSIKDENNHCTDVISHFKFHYNSQSDNFTANLYLDQPETSFNINKTNYNYFSYSDTQLNNSGRFDSIYRYESSPDLIVLPTILKSSKKSLLAHNLTHQFCINDDEFECTAIMNSNFKFDIYKTTHAINYIQCVITSSFVITQSRPSIMKNPSLLMTDKTTKKQTNKISRLFQSIKFKKSTNIASSSSSITNTSKASTVSTSKLTILIELKNKISQIITKSKKKKQILSDNEKSNNANISNKSSIATLVTLSKSCYSLFVNKSVETLNPREIRRTVSEPIIMNANLKSYRDSECTQRDSKYPTNNDSMFLTEESETTGKWNQKTVVTEALDELCCQVLKKVARQKSKLRNEKILNMAASSINKVGRVAINASSVPQTSNPKERDTLPLIMKALQFLNNEQVVTSSQSNSQSYRPLAQFRCLACQSNRTLDSVSSIRTYIPLSNREFSSSSSCPSTLNTVMEQDSDQIYSAYSNNLA